MAKLKELRINAGMTQPQLAEFIKANTPLISNYENDIALPDLEDAIILERQFSQKIDWQEALSPKRKHETIQALIELCEKYPLPMVSEFFARVYRRNQTPERFILHYASVVTDNDERPLLPVEVYGKKRCNDCDD